MTSQQSMPEGAPQNGTYRHYKGALYQVLGMARHSETDEWMVVYQALYGDFGFWLRPLSLWLAPVDDVMKQAELPIRTEATTDDLQVQTRFELLTPSDQSLTQLTKREEHSDE